VNDSLIDTNVIDTECVDRSIKVAYQDSYAEFICPYCGVVLYINDSWWDKPCKCGHHYHLVTQVVEILH
jgi:predicted RNA-binding Zn-ribbon protein involved in translation (DUF1610 family)